MTQDGKDPLSIFQSEEDAQIDGILGEAPTEESGIDQPAIRIVSVPLSQIIPDRFHARLILPPVIQHRVASDELDCYEAAKLLLEEARHDSMMRRRVDDLLELGASIVTEGQVEPAIGHWARSDSGSFHLFLETGGRRYWALALIHAHNNMQTELSLQVAECQEFNRTRQITSNIYTKGLSAIELGRTIATLVLLQHGNPPKQSIEVSNDYFREAVNMLHIPRSTWDALERRLSMSRETLERYLSYLKLPDDFQYKAALYRLTEEDLDAVLAVPLDHQEDMLAAAMERSRQRNEREKKILDLPEEDGEDVAAQVSGPAEIMANYIQNWYELASEGKEENDFMELADELSARIRDKEELALLARRLSNLARDVRVSYTSRVYKNPGG